MDKLQFLKEAGYLVSLVADNMKAMGNVFSYLRKHLEIDTMSWHFYDRAESVLKMAGVITPQGFVDLKNKIVPLNKQACRYSDKIVIQKFVHIDRTDKDLFAETIVEALSDYLELGEKSLFILHLE